MALNTQYFDDGSTLTVDDSSGYRSSTPSTDTGSQTFPGGETLMNALTYGFGRWVDYKTSPAPLQNNVPQLVKPSEQAAMQGGSLRIPGNLLLIGALVAGGIMLAKSE